MLICSFSHSIWLMSNHLSVRCLSSVSCLRCVEWPTCTCVCIFRQSADSGLLRFVTGFIMCLWLFACLSKAAFFADYLHKKAEAHLKIAEMRETKPSKHILPSGAVCLCYSFSGGLCLVHVILGQWINISTRLFLQNDLQQIWISKVFYGVSSPSLLSLPRGKHDGLNCLTLTARTPRETPHFGTKIRLCPGGTGADGAEVLASEEESPGRDLPRREESQGLQWTFLMTCPAAVTSARAVAAQMGWLRYQPPAYRGSQAAWTTKPPAATLCLNVRSWARMLCLPSIAPGHSSASRRSPTSCVSIRPGSSCQTHFHSSAPSSVRNC